MHQIKMIKRVNEYHFWYKDVYYMAYELGERLMIKRGSDVLYQSNGMTTNTDIGVEVANAFRKQLAEGTFVYARS
jgi:hypothetical protein